MIENIELLKEFVVKCLEEKKAEDIVVIDIKQKTTLAEYIILASGRSTKNVGAIAEYLSLELKHQANISTNIEGLEKSEWVLIDVGDILVNIFYPETREHFKLEEMWKKK
ncbi:ribosome silencing factor [Candidatus Tisiphia endosymbiont of Hybos culiciformis]|uniref:ribosome silencing factor n=1 Tax=Candidatus Tisiphia endosymbiont of Hybos culiciformis TaxID=3139331 RepID=UPI003CCB3190